MFSKINIISIGKTPQEFLEIENHYSKMIKTKIEFTILKNETLGNETQIIRKESEKISNKINGKTFIIILDVLGNSLSSEKFSKKLKDISLNHSQITIIIGGSHGISDELKYRSHLKISLSKMTLPHIMAKIILLEQLYRSETIQSGKIYHK